MRESWWLSWAKLPWFLGIGAALVSAVVAFPPPDAGVESEVRVGTAEEVLEELAAGNRRYVGGHRRFAHLGHQRIAETASGQRPMAAVLSCSDSRVPPEHIFDAGIGDLFVIRVAGNICDHDEEGSLEYAVDHLRIPLIVVVGHTRCGAVTAVVEHAAVEDHIPYLTEHIVPAYERVQGRVPPGTARAEVVDLTARENVHEALHTLIHDCPPIRNRVRAGELRVIGAMYDVETGRVEWLEPDSIERGEEGGPPESASASIAKEVGTR